MNIKKGFSLLLLVLSLQGTGLQAQTPHAPVSAGSNATDKADTTAVAKAERYKAAQEKDRERIKAAIAQGRENTKEINRSGEALQQKKLYAKLATSAAFGIIALAVYIRKKKKSRNESAGTGNA